MMEAENLDTPEEGLAPEADDACQDSAEKGAPKTGLRKIPRKKPKPKKSPTQDSELKTQNSVQASTITPSFNQSQQIAGARIELEDESIRSTAPLPAELAIKSEKKITAQDLLDKKAADTRVLAAEEKETHKAARDLKILAAIMLGKDKNRELAQVLDTDKSFTSKKIKELESQGLIRKETNGREVIYSVDKFNLLKFLQTRVIIKWGKEEGEKDQKGSDESDKERNKG